MESDHNQQELRQQFRQAALEYHEFPSPGKISVTPTKQLTNQRDLALAYSPGVAAACEEIAAEPSNAFRYTARGNLVAVITNGTAVLGLGNIGPLAAKPVMEGKGVLFKKFAGIDVFENEPAFNPEFLSLKNVVLTPHIGSATVPTRHAMAYCAADNLIAALSGSRPPNLLNPEAQPKS